MPSYPESEYCTFISPDGRRCRTLKMPTRQVCLAHADHDGQFVEDEAAIAELTQCSESLDNPRAVIRALGSLFRLTVQGKIPPRRASQLAYQGHLILCALSNETKLQRLARTLERRAASETPAPVPVAPALAAAAAAPSPPAAVAVPTDDDPIALPPLPVAFGSNGNGSNGAG